MLNQKIRVALDRYSMLRRGASVLLCVSGGYDSVAMLMAFNSLSKELGLKLYIAHFNHLLRGNNAKGDELYVGRLAGRLGLRFVAGRGNVRAFARSERLSLEDAARRLRYNFFIKTAKGLKVNIIATAHTRDDQAETVLMRLIRGAGPRGMAGIPYKSGVEGITLIRPMLAVSRKEVEDYLKHRGLRPRFDKSNKSLNILRNRLRLRFLPYIEKGYNPKIKEVLSNLAEIITADYSYIKQTEKRYFDRAVTARKEGLIAFSIAAFRSMHLSSQRGLARMAIETLRGTLDGIDFRHWEEIDSLIRSKKPGSVVNLPGGIEALKQRGRLLFRVGGTKRCYNSGQKKVMLNVPGTALIGRRKIEAVLADTCPGKKYSAKSSNKRIEYFDLDKIALPLVVRTRRPGDRMRPLGMRGSKKIKDILIDEKIPAARRGSLPLVASGSGDIIWLCGIKVSELCKISQKTKKILMLHLLPR